MEGESDRDVFVFLFTEKFDRILLFESTVFWVEINVGQFNKEDVDDEDVDDEDEGNTVEVNTLVFDVFGKDGASCTLATLLDRVWEDTDADLNDDE